MTTSAERRTDLLRKVRGLIDTADSYESMGQSEAAQSYRNKADNLMTMHAIEEFELATKGDNVKQSPELITYEYGQMPDEIRDDLTNIFWALAQHCRCKVGMFGWGKSKVVGYPADLEYLDVMFTGVRMHMSSNVRPQPSREMGYEAALSLLKESGMKWKDVYLRLLPLFPEQFVDTLANVSRQKPDSYGGRTPYQRRFETFQYQHPQTNWFESSVFLGNFVRVGDVIFEQEVPRSIGVRFTKEYTAFCKAHGRERVYADPQVWLRSFVQAYSIEIRRRLREMAKSTEESTTGKELVLRGIAEDLQEFFWDAFPNLRPHPADCDCDTCHRCDDPKCKRPRCVERRKPIRYRSEPERAFSNAAFQRGTAAARTADLTGRDRRVGSDNRKGLN